MREVVTLIKCEHDKETPATVPGVIISIPDVGAWQFDQCQECYDKLWAAIGDATVNAQPVNVRVTKIRLLDEPEPEPAPAPEPEPTPEPVAELDLSEQKPTPDAEPEPAMAKHDPPLPRGMVWKVAESGTGSRMLHAGWKNNTNGRCKFIKKPLGSSGKRTPKDVDFCKACVRSVALDISLGREPRIVSRFDRE